MSNYKVSIRYSSSLLENAINKKLLEVVTTDVELILQVFNSSKQLVSVMNSPVIKSQLKFSIINEIFKNKINDDFFIYFDPPYRPISITSSFTSYSKYDFTEEDQKRLAQFYCELGVNGNKLMLGKLLNENIIYNYSTFYMN